MNNAKTHQKIFILCPKTFASLPILSGFRKMVQEIWFKKSGSSNMVSEIGVSVCCNTGCGVSSPEIRKR